MDGQRLPALPGLPAPPPARSASTTASSWSTSTSCGAGAAPPRPATSRPTYRNFFPTGVTVGVQRARLAGVPSGVDPGVRSSSTSTWTPADWSEHLAERDPPGPQRRPAVDPARLVLRRAGLPSCSTRSPGWRSTTRPRRALDPAGPRRRDRRADRGRDPGRAGLRHVGEDHACCSTRCGRGRHAASASSPFDVSEEVLRSSADAVAATWPRARRARRGRRLPPAPGPDPDRPASPCWPSSAPPSATSTRTQRRVVPRARSAPPWTPTTGSCSAPTW